MEMCAVSAVSSSFSFVYASLRYWISLASRAFTSAIEIEASSSSLCGPGADSRSSFHKTRQRPNPRGIGPTRSLAGSLGTPRGCVEKYLRDVGYHLPQLAIDLGRDPLHAVGVDVVAKVHPRRDEQRVRTEDHGEELLDLVDLVVFLDRLLDPLPLLGAGGPADQHVRGVAAHPERDRDQHEADQDRGDRVVEEGARHLVHGDAEGGQSHARQCG